MMLSVLLLSKDKTFCLLCSTIIRATRNVIIKRLPAKQNLQNQDIPLVENAGRGIGISLTTGIKEMPAFDPDMEIRGVTLTIPTWIASIARAEQKTDMSLATDYAKKQLAEGLLRLKAQIQKTLEAIELI